MHKKKPENLKKVVAFLLFSVMASLPIVSGSCSGNTVTPEAVSTDPEVLVTWQGKFLGESSSGDLTLRVLVTVRNEGYKSFETSPDNFAVMVEGYSYDSTVSEFPDTVLSDGENVTGTLTFLVPPQAATSRVGYTFTHVKSPYKLAVTRDDIPVNSGVETVAADPVVKISYYTDLMWVSPPGVGFLEVDPPGSMYLMAELTIKNRGYASFITTPAYFSVEVSSAVESFSSEVEGLMIDWRDIELQNNGDYVGWLAFPVSSKIAQSFYQWNYKFKYNGPRKYTIEWRELTNEKYAAFEEKTRFQNVVIKDGENTTGTIAYIITPGIEEKDVTWEMQYIKDVGVADKYVQWADQTELDVDVNQDAIKFPAIKITYSIEIVKDEVDRRTYAMVHVLIENRGYDAFNAIPGDLYLEARY